jgi:hypothetical protein
MNIRSLCVCVGLFLVPVVACAPPIESHGEFVPAAPYAQFRTFSFAAPESTPIGYRTSARSIAVVEEMKSIVATALQAKGYAQAQAGEGDIILACAAGRREAETQMRLPWRVTELTGEEFEDHDFVEGGIVIDAFDRNGGQIWHGAARTEIDPMKPNAARLQGAVNAALTRFPAHRAR